jgi:hypothetical protein
MGAFAGLFGEAPKDHVIPLAQSEMLVELL